MQVPRAGQSRRAPPAAWPRAAMSGNGATLDGRSSHHPAAAGQSSVGERAAADQQKPGDQRLIGDQPLVPELVVARVHKTTRTRAAERAGFRSWRRAAPPCPHRKDAAGTSSSRDNLNSASANAERDRQTLDDELERRCQPQHLQHLPKWVRNRAAPPTAIKLPMRR